MTRYYGFYSNKSRGVRAKNEHTEFVESDNEIFASNGKVIDVSKYQPKNVPSLTWRECIRKIWKDDPLICPECSSIMKIISFIEQPQLIKKILKYLDLWEEALSRAPPVTSDILEEIVYIPVDDISWGQYEDSDFAS